MSIAPSQCRAARALLAWSQADLAAVSNVATKTIADFEREERTPYERTLADVQAALEAAGVEFIDGGQPGVRVRHWVKGDKAKLRRASERHAKSLGIESGEVAIVDEWNYFPGDPPWGRLQLKRVSGEILRGLDACHFERAINPNEAREQSAIRDRLAYLRPRLERALANAPKPVQDAVRDAYNALGAEWNPFPSSESIDALRWSLANLERRKSLLIEKCVATDEEIEQLYSRS